MARDQKLSSGQVRAIRRSLQVAKQLVREMPIVADYWKSGESYETMMQRPEVAQYAPERGNGRILRAALSRAMSGHSGGFGIQSFTGLIPNEEERREIMHEHARNNGKEIYQNRQGLYALTEEVLTETRRKAGKKSGELHRTNGTGVCGRKGQEKLEDSLAGVRARGKTPWFRKGDQFDDGSVCCITEHHMSYLLSQQEGFQRGSQAHLPAIQARINEWYHKGEEIRSTQAIKQALVRARKEYAIADDDKS